MFLDIALGILWAQATGPTGRYQSILRGAAYARANCVRCHSIDAGPSPLPRAPPFRTMRINYLVIDLIHPLTSGAHPPMPVFNVTRHQAMDLMEFINSLRED